jgi:hypothetical protein
VKKPTPRTSAALLLAGALVFGVVAVSCGGGDDKDEAKKAAATPTTKPAPPVAPLTGLPDPDGDGRGRCAVTVKIDNTRDSQPKWGVDQADVVYEEVVEGGITRLAAVFNSHAPDRVASVRSVRKTDQSLVAPLRGIFVYSGGAQYAIDSIDTAPVVQLDETRAGDLMFRDDRPAPYDLNARVDRMFEKCDKKDAPPQPLFFYRKADATVAGEPVASVRVGFLAGFAVTWTWDKTSGTWQRAIFDQPEVAGSGKQFAPANVVVLSTRYVGGNSYGLGAEAELVGTGPAWVFTAGKVVKGTWSRPDKSKPAQLLDGANSTIKLAPGQTWVELPDVSYEVTVTPPPTAGTTTP